LLNEGRYVLGVNASSYRIRRYFQDEHVLAFTVDGMGAPGKHWPEPRLGPLRPALEWKIERLEPGAAPIAQAGEEASRAAHRDQGYVE
jgi:lipopolysaccharide transport system ATP-binding protein